ncbi:MAG: class I SAM-dependent methyltransferase [Planctomycetia bacterium]|nr:class I SAM-dependent methyltransferase [Planctomycetia bacterium]
MQFYSRVIFPAVCDLILRQSFLVPYRREMLAQVEGEILEIGFGTGLNLSCYPAQVRRIVAIDPNPGMNRKARRRIEQSGIEVDQRLGECERLPFADGTFDCVVSSWTLCSIDDVNQAVAEVHRVLKPGGRYHFLEHGMSPLPGIQKWQRRLNGLEMRLAGGCHLDRNITAIVRTQPFTLVQADEFDLGKFPRTHGFMYRGVATK